MLLEAVLLSVIVQLDARNLVYTSALDGLKRNGMLNIGYQQPCTNESLLDVPHAHIEGNVRFQVRYVCNDGYMMLKESDEYLVCENGLWRGRRPTCIQPRSCSDISGKYEVEEEPTTRNINTLLKKYGELYKDVIHSGRTNIPGFVVGIDCRKKLLVVQCLPNGEWNSSTVCDTCSAPYLMNGRAVCEPSGRCDSAATVEFVCDEGYQRRGPWQATCINGEWDQSPPACLPVLTAPPTTPRAHTAMSGSLYITLAVAAAVVGLAVITTLTFNLCKRIKRRLATDRLPLTSAHNFEEEAGHLPTYEEALAEATPTTSNLNPLITSSSDEAQTTSTNDEPDAVNDRRLSVEQSNASKPQEDDTPEVVPKPEYDPHLL